MPLYEKRTYQVAIGEMPKVLKLEEELWSVVEAEGFSKHVVGWARRACKKTPSVPYSLEPIYSAFFPVFATIRSGRAGAYPWASTPSSRRRCARPARRGRAHGRVRRRAHRCHGRRSRAARCHGHVSPTLPNPFSSSAFGVSRCSSWPWRSTGARVPRAFLMTTWPVASTCTRATSSPQDSSP